MKKLRLVAASLFVLVPLVSYAQFDDVRLDNTWRSGSMLLTDNEIRKGYVKWDERAATVGFKTEIESDKGEEVYLPDRILAMEFYDSNLSAMRRFARFDISDSEAGQPYHMLGEILMEFNTFQVFSCKIVDVEADQVYYYNGAPMGGGITATSLTEIFYFISTVDGSSGREILYLPKFNNSRGYRGVHSRVDAPRFGRNALLQFMNGHKPEIETFLKENDFRLKKNNEHKTVLRDNFFKLLEYYKTLEQGSFEN